VSANTRHVCYCHSPMRYLWELYPHHLHDWTSSTMKRMLMAPVANYLRLWDYASAARVDTFVANSENVRRRIRRAWGRESEVIHPPVSVEQFFWKQPEDYFLIVSKMVAYKRLDIAVQAFSKTGRKLKIVGDGPELKTLRRIAGPGVEFCGYMPDDQLREVFARCRAFIMPGEEDFGMTMVEALASGKPVIALRRGGALEIVSEGPPVSGVFFEHPDPADLEDALNRFERIEAAVNVRALQESAARFSESVFHSKFRGAIGK
jgi:glycosyltransferase involved in cell wall biosynthesis